MTLAELYEQFRVKNRKLRCHSTDRVYRIAISQLHKALGHVPTTEDLTDDSLIALESFLSGRSPATINERTGRVKALWRWYAKQGGTHVWPTLDRLPVPEPYRRAWTVAQMAQLLDASLSFPGAYCGVPAGDWWFCFLRLLWDTGERSGAARRAQFDWLTDTGISVPAAARKGRKSAYYRLSDETLAAIESIRLPIRAEVFPWDRCEASYYLHYGRLLKLAGLPSDRKSKAQRIRRSHLTYWLAGGQDPTSRAQHASAATTREFYIDTSLLPQVDPADVLPRIPKPP